MSNSDLKEAIVYYAKALEGLERDVLYRTIGIELVNKSKLLSVTNEYEDHKGKVISHSLIRDMQDNEFLPLFTDEIEMNKWLDVIKVNGASTMVEVFDIYAKVLDENKDVKGIVIDPYDGNGGFMLSRESIEYWYDGEVLNYVSSATKDKVCSVLEKNIDVDKAWISINDNNIYRIVIMAYEGIDDIREQLYDALDLDEIDVVLHDEDNPEVSSPVYVRKSSLLN